MFAHIFGPKLASNFPLFPYKHKVINRIVGVYVRIVRIPIIKGVGPGPVVQPPPTRRRDPQQLPPKANEELGLDVSHEEDGKAVAVVEAELFLLLCFRLDVGLDSPKSNIDTKNDVFFLKHPKKRSLRNYI